MVTTLSERVKQLESTLDSGNGVKRGLGGELDGFVPEARQVKRTRAHEIVDSSYASPSTRERQLIADDESGSSHNVSDAEVEDAATVLEFLAWGRVKDSTLTSGLQVSEPAVIQPDRDILVSAQGLSTAWNASPGAISGESMLLENAQISHIQDKLPAKSQVYTMVEYHADYLLFMHCAFHVPSLKRELDHFYGEDQGVIRETSTSLQWMALLFAVLCGSMTCANLLHVVKWGFKKGIITMSLISMPVANVIFRGPDSAGQTVVPSGR